MNPAIQAFHPDDFRFFLDSEPAQAFVSLPMHSVLCLNVGCGIGDRVSELLYTLAET